MNVRPLFVANAQSSELIQPSERPLHDPAPSAQATAMFGVSFRKRRDDATPPELFVHISGFSLRSIADPSKVPPARADDSDYPLQRNAKHLPLPADDDA